MSPPNPLPVEIKQASTLVTRQKSALPSPVKSTNARPYGEPGSTAAENGLPDADGEQVAAYGFAPVIRQ
jgi:hypothetical protein